MTACFSLPDCFSACKTTQELPVTQLARHVNLFHLVIADNQRPETLSLPHGLAPPIKPTTQFTQVAAPWSGEWGAVLRSGFLINLSFHTWCGLNSAVPYFGQKTQPHKRIIIIIIEYYMHIYKMQIVQNGKNNNNKRSISSSNCHVP
jgi:hypothetical protein